MDLSQSSVQVKAHLDKLNFFNTGMNFKKNLLEKTLDLPIKIMPALTTRSKEDFNRKIEAYTTK